MTPGHRDRPRNAPGGRRGSPEIAGRGATAKLLPRFITTRLQSRDTPQSTPRYTPHDTCNRGRAAMTHAARHEYRHILRLLLLSQHGPKGRASAMLAEVRTIRKGQHPSWPPSTAHNVLVFLSNQREYTRLMELYNPSNQYSSLEQVSRTAKHVGLKVPQ